MRQSDLHHRIILSESIAERDVEVDHRIADAEPELRRLDVLNSFHAALAGGAKTGKSMRNTRCLEPFDERR